MLPLCARRRRLFHFLRSAENLTPHGGAPRICTLTTVAPRICTLTTVAPRICTLTANRRKCYHFVRSAGDCCVWLKKSSEPPFTECCERVCCANNYKGSWNESLFASSFTSLAFPSIRADSTSPITHREICWRIRNHRPAKTNRTEREMETRNETQTSESQEKSRQRLVRRDSMKNRRPDFSDNPDGPVKFHSDVKRSSACSEEHTTSLRQQQLKTTAS